MFTPRWLAALLALCCVAAEPLSALAAGDQGLQGGWAIDDTGGNGDNKYLQKFSSKAAVTLAAHFKDRVSAWEIWNEPNAWTSSPSSGVYQGGSFIYPSNFAWLLRHVYEGTHAAGLKDLTII